MLRLFIRLDLLLSILGIGELRLGERCRPLLIVAAACSEDKGGDLGGLLSETPALLSEMRRGRGCTGPGAAGAVEAAVGEAGSEFRSGAMLQHLSSSGCTRLLAGVKKLQV